MDSSFKKWEKKKKKKKKKKKEKKKKKKKRKKKKKKNGDMCCSGGGGWGEGFQEQNTSLFNYNNIGTEALFRCFLEKTIRDGA